MFTIDHLGIAVKSLSAAKSIYEKLGMSVSAEETVDAGDVAQRGDDGSGIGAGVVEQLGGGDGPLPDRGDHGLMVP